MNKKILSILYYPIIADDQIANRISAELQNTVYETLATKAPEIAPKAFDARVQKCFDNALAKYKLNKKNMAFSEITQLKVDCKASIIKSIESDLRTEDRIKLHESIIEARQLYDNLVDQAIQACITEDPVFFGDYTLTRCKKLLSESTEIPEIYSSEN